VLAQPKRLALLAYLAASPGGPHRRDTLLGMFWPELDQEHARRALNKAIHFIRDALGADAVLSRGAGELGLQSDLVWCDVEAFRTALDSGDLVRALELYRGDLLPGFFIAGGPAFDEWLERERARLRSCAADAAGRLAEREEAAGRLPRAAQYARRALDLSDGDERPLRRLIELLARMGDRVAAVHAYEEFARILARDLDLEPAAETVALIDRVRGAPPDPPPARVRSAPAFHSAASPSVPPGVPRLSLKRLLTTALAGALLASAVAAPLWLNHQAPAARTAETAAEVVAVLPFTVRGSDELAYLQEGMVDLLSVNLAGEGGLRTVNPRTLLSLTARRGGAAALQDPKRIRAFARELGAGSFIAGSVLAMGDRVQITATLSPLNPALGDTLQASVVGPIGDLAELVDNLTRQLLLGPLRGQGARFASLAASTTSSIDALKAFLEGERHWRARESDSAVASFRRAVSYDSSFALAYYRLAVAASWSPAGESGDALDHAMRHLDRLPPRNRNLVLAFEARRRREPARAESLYHAVLQASPDDGEAWFQLGSLFLHHQVLWGLPLRQVRDALDRALALDPSHPRAPGALSWLDGHEGRHQESARRMEQLVAVDQGEANPLLRAGLAFWRRDLTAEAQIVAVLSRMHDGRELMFAPDFVGQRAGDLPGAIRVARLLTDPSRSLAVRVRGYRTIANLELARGRPAAASATLAQLERLVPVVGIQVGALTLLNPAFPLSRSVADKWRLKLHAWTPESPADSARQDYLLGLLEGGEGNDAAAIELAERLESRAQAKAAGESPRDRTMRQDFALSIRATLAWRSGRLSDALTLLGRRHPGIWYPPEMDLVSSELVQLEYPFLNQAYERWMQAELLNGLGRNAEAMDWYAGLGMYIGEEMAYLPMSRLRMGEIYEKVGDTAAAIEQYARVLRLWSECDPELRPQMNDVRGRLSRLEARR
jgi:serine/threonine-protein kinase